MNDEIASRLAGRSGMSRNQGVDFLRGLGLWMLFVDHLKPNVWSHFTLAHLGISDFAEIFVFLSGFVSASMYGRALESGGINATIRKLGSRFAKIYIAHVVSMLAGLAILGALASRGLRLDDASLYLWMGDPVQYLARTFLLLYSPWLFSVLPLYLALSPVALAAAIALRRWPWWTLTSSFVVWCVAQSGTFDFYLMRDTWHFQPFAWQFLLILGTASQMHWAKVKRLAESRVLQALAIVVVLVSFMLRAERFFKLTPGFEHLLVYDNSKMHLAPLRLVHFLSLMILVIAIPCDWKKWLSTRAGRLAIAGGRDSLFIYSVTLVLAVILNLVLKGMDGGPPSQLVCCVVGLIIICGIADRRNKLPTRLHLQAEQPRE
jgi:hypothetical protein